jgi:hypothetical protein
LISNFIARMLPTSSLILVAANVAAAVGLVLLNKALLRAWPFALALTASHAVFTQAATRALRAACSASCS